MNDEELMALAINEAKKAYEENEVPVGAAVVLNDKVIGLGHNKRESKLDISSHAEIEAIKSAAKTLGSWNLEGCTLYVTVEPCLMCSGAILQSNIHRVVYGADDPTMGAVCSRFGAFDDPSFANRPLITKGVLENECKTLIKKFFEELR